MQREEELDALGRARLDRDRARRGLGWEGQEMPRGLRAGTERPSYFWDTGKGLAVEMVFVPQSATTGPFYIARHPTIWREFRTFCADAGHPVPPDPHWGGFDDHPVVNVTWSDAAAFCAWAGLRLPTSQEWFAAASGRGTTWPWGDERPSQERLVWREHAVYGGRTTAPVSTCAGGEAASGARHASGNVREWCEDAHEVSGGWSLIAGPTLLRHTRGGSFNDDEEHCLPTAVVLLESGRHFEDVGFRALRPG